MRPRAVIDTNVLYAGLRSRRGASFQVLDRLWQGQWIIVALTVLILAAQALRVLSAPGGSSALLSKERMLMVKGKPRFILGLYENPRDDVVVKPPVVHQAETYGSIDGRGILCSVRRVADDFVLLVVNDTENGLRFSLENLPAKLNGRTLYRLYSPEENAIAGRRLTDGIKSWDVHVYATSRRFEDPLARGR